MNFCFQTPDGQGCSGRLWACGRYGFSLPKTVEILGPDGQVRRYLLPKRLAHGHPDLPNRTLVRIAIAQFLRGDGAAGASVELDPDTVPYPGEVKPAPPREPRTPLRVHPGRAHARRGPGA